MTGPGEPSGSSTSRVLVVGVDPRTLNPAEWGVTADENAAVLTAIGQAEQDFRDAGYEIEMCLIALDADLAGSLVPRLRARDWDVVVIGGGLRHPPELLELFERVVNAVHRHAPQASIAFGTKPTDCRQAAERWIGRRTP